MPYAKSFSSPPGGDYDAEDPQAYDDASTLSTGSQPTKDPNAVLLPAIFDGRIVQPQPAYSIYKGSSQISNQSFTANSATSSAHVYNIQCATENTFVARDVQWSTQVALSLTYALPSLGTLHAPKTSAAATAAVPTPVVLVIKPMGQSWSWAAWPLQNLTSTLQCQINNQVVSVTTGDVLNEVLRLVDIASDRQCRTTPTKLDYFATCADDRYIYDSVYGAGTKRTWEGNEPNGNFKYGGVSGSSSGANYSGVTPYVDASGNPWVLGTVNTISLAAPLSTSSYISYTNIAFGVGGAASSAGGTPAAGAAGYMTVALGTAAGVASSATAGSDGSVVITLVGGQGGSGTGSAPAPTDGTDTTWGTNGTITLWTTPTFVENLVLPPFLFSNHFEGQVGLFGIQQMNFTMTMKSPQAGRIVRQLNEGITWISGGAGDSVVFPTSLTTNSLASTLSVAYTSLNNVATFTNSRINIVQLSPSLDLQLPPKSNVLWMEFPFNIANNYSTISPYTVRSAGANSATVLNTGTWTLNQIPDLMLYVVEPNVYGYSGSTQLTGVRSALGQAKWYLCPTNITLQWGVASGLMSSMTQEQLWLMSRENGLDMSYEQFSGRIQLDQPSFSSITGNIADAGLTTAAIIAASITPQGPLAQTTGGFLVIKPGKDFPLGVGQACGLVGSWTVQANITVYNYSQSTVTPQIKLITVNTGFFQSVRGTSQVVKGILTETSIIGAEPATNPSAQGLTRAIGGSWSSLFKNVAGHVINHGPALLDAAVKHGPGAVSAVRGFLGKGTSGGNGTGGNRTGGGNPYKRLRC